MSNVAIPGYRIERLLGEGGRGIVYEGHDTRSDRRVALKILHGGQGRNSEKLVALKHPHIAAVLDVGRFGAQVFVATEYLSGGTLKEHIQSLQSVGDTFPSDQILSYANQIADALVYAHGQRISHGHLGSEDVMFSEDGTLKLTDFNPETGIDFQQATQTDLIAYGGLLSELATGKRPLPGAHVPRAIVRSDLPVTFTRLVVRILDRHRQDRYEDLSQVIDDLRPAASDLVTHAGVSCPGVHSNFGAGRVLAERFRIVEFIAMGGMGEVYEAEDLELGERVALKTIRPEVASSPQALDRFKREIQLARKVTHPNVCRIFDFFYDDAGPEKVTFLTMELLRGETLHQKIQRDGRMRSEQALPIVRQMAAGLAAAHSAGVVHRDFKSSNVILVLSEGSSPGIRAVVTDFGLARPAPGPAAMTTLSGAAEFLGTPAYMAPEQIEGEEVTAATDIYAFGVVMYEMVAGKLPFTGETSVAVALKRLQGPPVSPRQYAPDLETVWEDAILRCLQRRPQDRFAQIGNLIGALDGSAVAAPTPVPVGAPALSIWRRNLIVAALLTVFLLGLFLVRFSSRSHSEGRSRRSVAVLGFKNSTGQADAAWLSTALSEMLITEIAAGEKLRAVPGETVARMRSELSLPDAGSFAPETLLRIRNYLGADVLVYGSYVVSSGTPSKVRMDLRLQDSGQGTVLASISEEGYAADLLEVVSRSGADLRDRLGVEQLDPAQAEAKRAALPATPQAARFYAEGLDRLRVYDAAGAQAALEKAIAADNRYALARSALATSWSMLGYAKKAQEQSKIALDLSTKLGREEQLLVEGRFRETSLQWKEAVVVYRTLFGFFPDNLEYGLRLASAQTSAGDPKDALATIEILRKFPPPDRDSPRIDLTEARAAGSLSDFIREQAAASTAANKGRRDGTKLLVAGARLIEGNAFASLGESSRARAAFEDARQIYTEAADGWDAANASTNLAYVLMQSGDPGAAESIYRQSLALYRQLGDRKGTAAALAALATILRNRGDLGGARKLHEEALGIHVEIADRAGEATASNNIANTLSLIGDSVAARRMYEKALPIFKEIGDRNGAATVLSNLGDIVTEEGDFFRARALYEESRDTFQQIGNKSSLAYELSRIGDLDQINGDLSAARGGYEQALELRKQLSEKPGIGESQLELAQIALGEGKPADAETLATAAVEAFRSADRPDDQASALSVLARSFLIRQKYPESAKAIQDAQNLSKKSRDAAVRISVAITAASITAARGDRTAALKDLDAAVKEARNASMIRLELEGRLAHAEIEIAAGRWQAGRQQLDALENEASSRGYKYVADRAAAARRRIPNTAA